MMSENTDPVIGVSPAYFVSRFTNRFTPQNVADSLQDIAEMGFSGVQLEVFHRETLDAWLSGAGKVKDALDRSGLQATQFVAHFLLHGFASAEAIRDESYLQDMDKVLRIVEPFEHCPVVTVPLGPFAVEPGRGVGPESYEQLHAMVMDSLYEYGRKVRAAGREFAVEVLPGAFIGGLDGYLRLCDLMGDDAPGLNLDTGHANACKENPGLLAAKMGNRVVGTHLSDNYGFENFSMRPGLGNVEWFQLLTGLHDAGYRGAYDLEIICPAEECRDEYVKGRELLEDFMIEATDEFIRKRETAKC